MDLKVVKGMEHCLLVLMTELLPSQSAVYSDQVDELVRISILYAVMLNPLSLGKLHVMSTLVPTTDVVGVKGASGALAA